MKTKNLFAKFTATAMAALMLTSSVALPANAAETDYVSVSSSVLYSGTCGDNVVWELYDDGTLLISGTGATNDIYYRDNTPWYAYKNDIKTIVVDEGVEYLGEYLFKDCSSVTTVTISDTVTDFGDNIFAYCSNITELNIGKAFAGEVSDLRMDVSTNLEEINISSENTNYCSVNGIVYTKDMKTLVKVPRKYNGEAFVIPSSVTTISDYAFEYSNLKKVIIPDSVTSIGEGAFLNSALESVDIPDSVTTVGESVFAVCKNLSEVNISNSIEKITPSMFNSCTALKSIEIPESVTYIDFWAFQYSGLEKVVIPANVETIDCSAFAYCDDLTYVETQGTKKIYGGAFKHNPKLETVIIGDGIEMIDGYVFEACTSLKNVTFGEGLKELSWGTFYQCTALEYFTAPKSCKYADSGVFYDCTALKEVTVLNKDMSIYSGFLSYTGDTTPTAKGYVGSTYDKYANTYGINFVAIEEPLMGDVDCDGVVTVSDATTIQLHLGGLFPQYDPLTARQLEICDANGDGDIDINDVTVIQMYVARLIDSL